jgi:hypothetical protein
MYFGVILVFVGFVVNIVAVGRVCGVILVHVSFVVDTVAVGRVCGVILVHVSFVVDIVAVGRVFRGNLSPREFCGGHSGSGTGFSG